MYTSINSVTFTFNSLWALTCFQIENKTTNASLDVRRCYLKPQWDRNDDFEIDCAAQSCQVLADAQEICHICHVFLKISIFPLCPGINDFIEKWMPLLHTVVLQWLKSLLCLGVACTVIQLPCLSVTVCRMELVIPCGIFMRIFGNVCKIPRLVLAFGSYSDTC